MVNSIDGASERTDLARGEFSIRLSGADADRNAIDVVTLAKCLQGFDRFMQLATYAYSTQTLRIPKKRTQHRASVQLTQVRQGSVLIDLAVWLRNETGSAVVALAVAGVWTLGFRLYKMHVETKARTNSLDDVVDVVEEAANREGLRVSKDRTDSETFVLAMNQSLDALTVPLDSAAAKQVLSLRGAELDIVVDNDGRLAIKTPFAPPNAIDDAEDIFESDVRVSMVDKVSGWGHFEFVSPDGPSQVGKQRFHCQDEAITRRANSYTGALHEGTRLRVRIQRRNYAVDRRGHYWIILGLATEGHDQGLWGTLSKRPSGKSRRKPSKGRKRK